MPLYVQGVLVLVFVEVLVLKGVTKTIPMVHKLPSHLRNKL